MSAVLTADYCDGVRVRLRAGRLSVRGGLETVPSTQEAFPFVPLDRFR